MDQYHSLPSYSSPYYGVLELCLNDILSCIKPSENDRLKRQYTISELTTLVQSVENLKDVVVRPFGSFTSNLYTKWGDLDTSVELSHSSPCSTANIHKQTALRGVMEVLQRNGVARNFNFIPNANVPLLKFESNHHNISCDVSVDNHVGWMKSKILLLISEVDERFRDMVLLTKEWAKAHHINHSKLGTLNSYSLCLLVIFFFQTCKPAILPPLKDIYEGNFYDLRGTWSTLERQIEYTCAANIARFKSLRQINQSTLCQLLISFFDKFSEIERMSSEYAICTYTGQLERIDNNHRWMKKSYRLLVEDPFERPDNAARAVGFRGLVKISEAFKRTSQGLSSYSVLSDRNALLACLVRAAAAALMLENENHKFMGRPPMERDLIGMMNPGSRKIYFTYPSNSTFSEEDVSNYFSIYGPVQDVRIPYQQKRMFGFVTFVYPETVNLILARGNPHFVCNARVLVKPYKEKGKFPDKKQQHGKRFDFSGCTTPTELDSRDPFDLQQLASPRMMYGGNSHEVLLRRKMEGQQAAAKLQQAIEMQGRRFMGLQLLDIKNRSLASTTAPILSPLATPNSTTFNNTSVFSDAGSSSNGRQDEDKSMSPAISATAAISTAADKQQSAVNSGEND